MSALHSAPEWIVSELDGQWWVRPGIGAYREGPHSSAADAMAHGELLAACWIDWTQAAPGQWHGRETGSLAPAGDDNYRQADRLAG